MFLGPVDPFVEINVDGSYKRQSGLVQDSNGRFIFSFFSKIGAFNALFSKLWGLKLGILLTRSLHISKAIFEMDSTG